jgi:hypothetical protein
VSKEPHRLSTGKLLANIARSGPNMAMISSTIHRFSDTLQGRSRCPSPEILTRTFGSAANLAIAWRQPESPSLLRSDGKPAWLRIMSVRGKLRASLAASSRFHQGVCRSKCRPYRSSREQPDGTVVAGYGPPNCRSRSGPKFDWLLISKLQRP